MKQTAQGSGPHTLVLFNSGVALGTLSGVGKDPVGGFTFIGTLLLPLLKLQARARFMGFFTALKAKEHSTRA